MLFVLKYVNKIQCQVLKKIKLRTFLKQLNKTKIDEYFKVSSFLSNAQLLETLLKLFFTEMTIFL